MRRVIGFFCIFLALSHVATAAENDWRFDGVGRVIAIADVHGAFDAMLATLRNASVIDDERHWIAGDAHLVVVGDLLDRGPDSRKAMDLLMRLEREAEVASGKVHVLLGNHEVMNLVGDLRYVSKEEYAAFAGEESAAERNRWFGLYSRRVLAEAAELEALRITFDGKFPAGYFAHRRAFASDGKYGAWLLAKPIIVVINDTAFVHGGLAPLIGTRGLAAVNQRLQNELRAYVRDLGVLQQAGVLLPTDGFYEHESILNAYLPGLNTAAETVRAADAIVKLGQSDLHALDGPLWYRGNANCSRLFEQDRLEQALSALGAERVVVGHTPTPNRRVLKRLDGRVIEIDTGMLNAYYGGRGHALIIVDDVLGVVSEIDDDLELPRPHPRQVGARPGVYMEADAIERLLSEGEILGSREDEIKRRIVTLGDGTHTIEALFTERARRGVYPDVAAYRLDRLLELEFVPAAVVREVDGREGSLQFLPENAVDEPTRAASGSGGAASCPLNVQWSAMYVFDALIYNQGRSLQRMLYNPQNWQLMLIGHGNAFSTSRGRPAYLEEQALELTDAWIDALESLSEERIESELGDVLDKRRRRALMARRDELLQAAMPVDKAASLVKP